MKINRIRLVPASPAHVGRIANRLREMDRIECEARGRSAKQSLRRALRASSWAITAFVDERPEAMFGISPVSTIEDRGCPWFLGTDEVFRHGRDMLTIGGSVVAQMHRHSGRLENSVATINEPAIRMLRRWGFTVDDAPFMVGGVEFVRFWREAKHV